MSRPAPASVRILREWIRQESLKSGVAAERIERSVANTVVGQMLPPGVVKGGTSLKLRVGERASRFTPDFDAAWASTTTLEAYMEQLEDSLEAGWGGFGGKIVELEPAKPEGVPGEYVMRPFAIKLQYKGKPWLTVKFELGRDEVGSTEKWEMALADDLVELFEKLGLPKPDPVAVMLAEHQVAQKLHACTGVDKTGSNERAHDLVDLQILERQKPIDVAEAGRVAKRLFAARRAQAWPPKVVVFEGWDSLYAEEAKGLDVLGSVEEAVEWANDLVEAMVAGVRPPGEFGKDKDEAAGEIGL
jgi:hypothetical protein